jgi:hypothetical protein
VAERVLVSVTHGNACYGLIVVDGLVVAGAPIARRYVGLPAPAVLGTLRRSGALLVTFDPSEESYSA